MAGVGVWPAGSALLTKVADKRRAGLISRMDVEAESLLANAKDGASLETRIAIFAQIAKWVQVRNRITDGDDTSGLLNEYRRTIDAATSEIAKREAERVKAAHYESSSGYGVGKSPRYTGRNQRHAKGGTRDNGGAELEALKSRLPAANEHDADDARGGSGGEIVVDAGPMRVVRTELPGRARSEFDEPSSGDDF